MDAPDARVRALSGNAAPPGTASAAAPRGSPAPSERDAYLGLTVDRSAAAAVQPAAARAGEKRSRDDAGEDEGARKAAASAAEQASCGDGATCTVAAPNAAAAAAADDTSYFDYAKEAAALGDTLFRKPMPAPDAPTGLAGVMGAFMDYERQYAELRARAVAARFYGFTPEARALALELLCRRRAALSVMPGVAVADEAWQERRVKGSHTKPCGTCGVAFAQYGQLFF